MALKGDTSNLDTFTHAGAPMLPLASSYNVTLPNGVAASSIAGGMSKMQLQFQNAPYYVSCTYRTMNYFDSAYIEGFFKRHLGQKFIAYLVLEGTSPEPYVVQVISEIETTKRADGGDTAITYEVMNATDRCYEQVIQDWGECVGNPTCVWADIAQGIRNLPDGTN